MQTLKTILSSNGNKKFSAQRTKYTKNDAIKHYGIRAPQLQKIFPPYYNEHVLPLSLEDRKQLAQDLIGSMYSEEREIGVYILKKDLKHLGVADIDMFRTLVRDHVDHWYISL